MVPAKSKLGATEPRIAIPGTEVLTAKARYAIAKVYYANSETPNLRDIEPEE